MQSVLRLKFSECVNYLVLSFVFTLHRSHYSALLFPCTLISLLPYVFNFSFFVPLFFFTPLKIHSFVFFFFFPSLSLFQSPLFPRHIFSSLPLIFSVFPLSLLPTFPPLSSFYPLSCLLSYQIFSVFSSLVSEFRLINLSLDSSYFFPLFPLIFVI